MRMVCRSLALATLFVMGCGSPEFAEVDGYVTLDGKPLGDVEVVFIPDIGKGCSGNNASAFTDSDGYYRLYAPRDKRTGTLLGIHRVLIVDLSVVVDLTRAGLPGAGGGVDAPQMPGAKPRRFPVKYGDVFATPFQDVEVKSGQQTLHFELHSSPTKNKILPKGE